MADLQIIEAVKAGDLTTVQVLIESGGDVNQSDEQGWTPLNFAAGKGHLAIIKLLIEKGADVFKVGRDQRTPYRIALAASHVETAKYLREVEAKLGGRKDDRPERKYCKAYYLRSLRKFPGWTESKINWREEKDISADDDSFDDNTIVFLHQDFSITKSMWHNEDVIFNNVSDQWQEFCANVLEFQVPDDLDLVASAPKSE